MRTEEFASESDNPGAAFFTGLFAGALIGTGFGVLFAPWRGAELRGQIAESAATASQAVSTTVDEWSARGRDAYGRARDLATYASDGIDRVAGDASKFVGKAVSAASDVASAAAASTRRFERSSGV